jgi:hypothetical protein
VVLAHGSQAATWKGKTMTQIANTLAAAGEAVVGGDTWYIMLFALSNSCVPFHNKFTYGKWK